MQTTMKNSIPQKNYIASLDSFELEKVNILIVDDRPENLLALEAALESTNYNVVSASSGEEALRCVLKEEYSVILLDVQMPVLNGFETAKLIKQRGKTKHIPIIFVTALSQAEENVQQGYAVGAIDYIFKPFHPETLRQKIAGFVQLYLNQKKIKLQREQLDRSSRQIKSILGSITDVFYAVDRNWCFTYLNKEAERLLGASTDCLFGQNLWVKYNSMFAAVRHELYEAMDKKLPLQFELRLDETEKMYDVRAYPSTTGLSVYLRDITKRKQMEQDLFFSEERFRKIVESSPCLISIRSLTDNRYFGVNPSWVYYTGYSYDEVMEEAFGGSCFKIISAEEEITHTSSLTELLRNVRISYTTKAGVVRQGLLSTEFIEIQGERYILTVITDITERVRLEKEITRLDRLNIIGEMAAGIAHEVRNPMTTVCGFLQLAKDKKEVLSPEYIDLMVDELNRANAIIKEFLTLAKNKTTDKKFKKINDIIQVLLPLIQADAMLNDKYIDLDLNECPQLLLDEKEIRQLILNLVKNGLEEMPPGKRLMIRTYAQEQEVILEVHDQGRGIPEEIIEKIGTPFFTTKEWGTGLGLAVCYSIAERHNAVIELKTGREGTIFITRFNANQK